MSARDQTFSDSEAHTNIDHILLHQFHGDGSVIARHNHLAAGRKSDTTSNISGPEEELRTIVGEEWLVTTALLQKQYEILFEVVILMVHRLLA